MVPSLPIDGEEYTELPVLNDQILSPGFNSCPKADEQTTAAAIVEIMSFFIIPLKMVRPTGLEPVTSSFGNWRSIQLNYGRNL